MAKKSVLKAFVANKSQVSVCFIQKVTDKIICVIRDEKGTEYHHLTDGTLRTSDKTKKSFVVDSEAVQKFLADSHLKVWDGGWKPDYNSRGEQKSKKLGSLSAELSAGGTYETWLTKAGFNIEMLPMSASIAALLKGEVAEPKQEELPFDESPADDTQDSEAQEYTAETSQEASEPQSEEAPSEEVDDAQSPQDYAESSEVADSEAPAEESKPKKAKAAKTSKSKTTKTKATKATKTSKSKKAKVESEVEDEAPAEESFNDPELESQFSGDDTDFNDAAEEFDDQEVGDDEFDF